MVRGSWTCRSSNTCGKRSRSGRWDRFHLSISSAYFKTNNWLSVSSCVSSWSSENTIKTNLAPSAVLRWGTLLMMQVSTASKKKCLTINKYIYLSINNGNSQDIPVHLISCQFMDFIFKKKMFPILFRIVIQLFYYKPQQWFNIHWIGLKCELNIQETIRIIAKKCHWKLQILYYLIFRLWK